MVKTFPWLRYLMLLFIMIVAIFAVVFLLQQNRSDQLVQDSLKANTMGTLLLSSTAFVQNGAIPREYTCQGSDINPPLTFESVPSSAKSLALIVDDPDSSGGVWDHWLLWNIVPRVQSIAVGRVPEGAEQGVNGWGRPSYGGPCPPLGEHRYRFTLYALTETLSIPAGSDRTTLMTAMQGKIIDQTTLIGLYKKS
jgi:Raf kinase inhibitor-like YbhB/YbcL family protein